jgi:uncharacterized protein (TIGR03067 family)
VDDWQDFQGTWQALWLAQDGRKMTAEEVHDTRLLVSGDRYTLHRGGHDFRGTISRVDRTGRAGVVDFVADEPGDGQRPWLGIYLLGDDELSVCVAPPDQDRPTSFTARRGSGHSLYLLKRSVTPAVHA